MKKTLIERYDVPSGGQATITFGSIPQTYDGLYLLLSARTTDTNIIDFTYVYPNGNTSNLSYKLLRGDGAAASSFSLPRNYVNADTSTANTFGNLSLFIPNYASSNPKSMSSDFVGENNATNSYAGIQATLWNDTTAISSLTLDAAASGAIFKQYTTASLYGITAGSDGVTTVS